MTHQERLRALVGGLDLDQLLYEEHIQNGIHHVSLRWLPKRCQQETNLLAHLEAGWSFEPSFHRYPAEMLILRGAGVFSVNGVDVVYGPGLFLRIGRDSVHGFQEVREDTLFVKSVSYRPLPPLLYH